jgi:hypothetical protein
MLVGLLFGGGVAVADDIPDLSTCPTMSKGLSGPCVLALKQAIKATGVTVYMDDKYDDQTEAAVRAFQQFHGLPPNGVAGPETIAAYVQAATSPPPAAPSSGTVSGQSPDGTVGDDFVYACGNLFGTCTLYLGRDSTRQLNTALNDPDVGKDLDYSSWAVCIRIGASSPPAGVACELIGIWGKAKVQKAAARAVEQHGCIKFKMLSDPIIPTSVASDNGRNCIGS